MVEAKRHQGLAFIFCQRQILVWAGIKPRSVYSKLTRLTIESIIKWVVLSLFQIARMFPGSREDRTKLICL